MQALWDLQAMPRPDPHQVLLEDFVGLEYIRTELSARGFLPCHHTCLDLHYSCSFHHTVPILAEGLRSLQFDKHSKT